MANDADAWTLLLTRCGPTLEGYIRRLCLRYGRRDENQIEAVRLWVFANLLDQTRGRLRDYEAQQQAQQAPLTDASLNAFLVRMAHSRVRALVRAQDTRRRHERAHTQKAAATAPMTDRERSEAIIYLSQSLPKSAGLRMAFRIEVLNDPTATYPPGTTATQRWQLKSRLWQWSKKMLAP